MSESGRIVVFTLAERQLAFPLDEVERVVRAVEIVSLPQEHDTTLGVVNIQGRIIPVIDIRGLFALPQREIEPSDVFVVVHTSGRSLVIVADTVRGVVEYADSDMIAADDVLVGQECVAGVLKYGEETVLVCSAAGLLSRIDEQAMNVPQKE
jgi:purine-binding chemotaxis protein CheW